MTHWADRLYEDQAATFATLFEERFDRAENEVTELLELVSDERGVEPERVLDVACGTGRHALWFAEHGRQVEGLDFSEGFIDRARDAAAERGIEDRVRFHVEDMRDLDAWDGTYDLVTCFWNSLGHYEKRTDVDVLTAMRTLLSEQGLLVVEMSNREYQIRNFESSGVREVDDRLHVSRRELDPTTGRFHATVDVFSTEGDEYEHLETMEFRPRIYAPVELREMCERAGFDAVDLFGGFDGDDLSIDSPRVVVLAD